MSNKKDIIEIVRERYAAAAEQVTRGSSGTCCSTAGCCSGGPELIFGLENYHPDQVQNLPTLATSASLGCGNPVAHANLVEGETVLDLGSGGGIDCFLSAGLVGPSGHVYGLDMTDEMLSLARANLKQTSFTNVTFMKGRLDAIPLPDESVDVVISNCVVNLAPDKERVLREVFRVLRPGGRIAIADVVAVRPLPEEIRKDQAAWAGWIGGALLDQEYKTILEKTGFTDVGLKVLHTYDLASPAADSLVPQLSRELREAYSDAVTSTLVSARKPNS